MPDALLIVPFFGDPPPWFDQWQESVGRLEAHGYRVLLDRDEDTFRDRVREILQLDPPPMAGTGKAWDFRPALGLLYERELAAHSHWGHTDMDVVYGRVWEWLTPEFLDGLDLHSNHHDYVCGFWSLYRNTPTMRELFTETPGYRDLMTSDHASGWIESAYSDVVDAAHEEGRLNRVYTYWQTRDLNSFDTLTWDGERLLEGDREVFAAHFRRVKEWPAGC